LVLQILPKKSHPKTDWFVSCVKSHWFWVINKPITTFWWLLYTIVIYS
jgi:hypothetical protein